MRKRFVIIPILLLTVLLNGCATKTEEKTSVESGSTSEQVFSGLEESDELVVDVEEGQDVNGL